MAAAHRSIGLFGGSFDPVHNGHLAAARRAREAGGLDEVVFIPAAVSPFKADRALAPDADRLAMLRLAVAGEPGFSVSDFEIAKAGVSYTVDTARHFAAVWPGTRLVFILGADSLATLGQWREAGALADLCDFIALARPGWRTDRVPGSDAGTEARLRVEIVADFAQDVSSTQIRRRLAAGLPVDELVPPAVAAYIRERELYRPRPISGDVSV